MSLGRYEAVVKAEILLVVEANTDKEAMEKALKEIDELTKDLQAAGQFGFQDGRVTYTGEA